MEFLGSEKFFWLMMGLAVVVGAGYVFLVIRPRMSVLAARKRQGPVSGQEKAVQKAGSTQDILGFDDVVDGVVVLPGGRYRLVMEVMGTINFPLMSDEEQDAVEASFSTFLMGLAAMGSPVQMYVQSRKLDLQPQIDAILAGKQDLPANIQAYTDEHAAYLRRWMDYAPYVNRRYIVLPYDAPGGCTFERAKRELLRRKEVLERHVARYLTCRVLDTDEIVDLFYTILNKHKATAQRSQDAFALRFFEPWVKGVSLGEVRAAVAPEEVGQGLGQEQGEGRSAAGGR